MVSIRVVTGRRLTNKFIGFPYNLYRKDSNYVPELRIAQRDILNRKKNPFFQHSEAEYFIAIDEKERLLDALLRLLMLNMLSIGMKITGSLDFSSALMTKK